jgi:hypothetical protein
VDDVEAVSLQLGRRPRAFARVAARCPWGRPAVTEQHPYDSAGRPFPTTYYLTCRHLVAGISRLEAAGGVERWTERVAHDPELHAELLRAAARQAEIRSALADGNAGPDDGDTLQTGIGGSRNPTRLKCLHAHVAFALAVPRYTIGDAILAEVDPLWPAECCLTMRGVEGES